MSTLVGVVAKALFVCAGVAALATAVVWPWPAPEVDWRPPVEAALTANDCDRATRILDTAVASGSIEAVRFRAKVSGGPCYDSLPRPNDAMRESLLLDARGNGLMATADALYGLSRKELGFWRDTYVAGAIFLCAAPYNALHSADNTEISKVVFDDPPLAVALHQRRRALCVAVVRDLAESFVALNDPSAHEVALELLQKEPLASDAESSVALADLLLRQGFVPARTDDMMTAGIRRMAWFGLEIAAGKGNERAMRMMASLLHAGRFRPRDDVEAYAWVLRLRRMGKPEGAESRDIEEALDTEGRRRAAGIAGS
jgi:hypothetical protein